MYDKKRNHKKIKKRRSFRAVFLTALICAAVSVLVIVGALWFVGLRYVSLNTADGTKIKFFGMVDSDGTPRRGKIVYSIGLIADVDRDRDTISYSDGSSYSGGLDGLLKSGQGKMYYANGDIYEGEWSGDMINGHGVYSYVNGDVYEGSFVNSEKSGEGKYTWQDGSVYEGTFDANLRHGHGVLTTAGGDSYDGGFERDKKSGEGKYTWATATPMRERISTICAPARVR